ncbi:hypothetical protein [Nocardia acidivorans]|nr:hypothetical protein [Nocardia acidivorans]
MSWSRFGSTMKYTAPPHGGTGGRTVRGDGGQRTECGDDGKAELQQAR